MSDTAKIIDYCLKGIGEDTVAPVEITRAECLEIINQLYQNDIGKRLKILASFSYDASDAAHTITSGVGTLPSDCLQVSQVYDGDANTNVPLEQILFIDNKVADDDVTSQYMTPDLTALWIFGTTPTNTVKVYYYKQPVALTDASSSIPTALKPEFHIDIFVARIKEVYAMRQNNTGDAMDMKALVLDLLTQIEVAHGHEKKDDGPGFRPALRW